MAKSPTPALLQGTLDLLILHALQRGALHGYAIAQTIHLLSDEVLRVEEGSLYPALYRLELDGAIAATWGLSENNRKAKYYELTRHGRRVLAAQHDTWTRLSMAVGRVLATPALARTSPCVASFARSCVADGSNVNSRPRSPSIARWRRRMATPPRSATPSSCRSRCATSGTSP